MRHCVGILLFVSDASRLSVRLFVLESLCTIAAHCELRESVIHVYLVQIRSAVLPTLTLDSSSFGEKRKS